MSLYKNYAMDADKEINGVSVEVDQNENGTFATFVLSRMGTTNKRYSKALEFATRPYRRQIELETMDNGLAEKIFRKVFCETVLLGWSNVYGRDGEEIKFTSSAAIALFEDLPLLYEELSAKAKSVGLFREETTEDEAKN